MTGFILFLVLAASQGTGLKNSDCIQCHEDVNIENSKHESSSCTDCHTGITELPHPETISPPRCSSCHEEEYSEHKESIHGKAIEHGIKEAAHCWDCHGAHQIADLSDTSSPVYPLNLPETCGRCHGDPELAKKFGIPIKNPYDLYMHSVHHSALLKGEKAATCSDCHGVHNIRKLQDPQSSIAKKNIPKTCSQCHKKEYEDYAQSIHYEAFLQGVRESPICTDCHAEHRILSIENPESPVYPFNVPKTCSDCHERYVIVEKYGIPGLRLSTYLESFHGLALKAGNLYAANCTSCHERHFILPASNPRSSINPSNLSKTCGKCHPGLQLKEGATIHKRTGTIGDKVINLVKRIYIWLIVVTIGGMILFVFIDWLNKTRHPEIIRREIRENPFKFNREEKALHLIHLISFFMLAYTGFAFRYPDTFFTSWLSSLMSGAVRSYLHRSFGLILIIVFLLQVVLIIFTKRGREQIRALLPKMKDVRDAFRLLLFNLRVTDKRPLYENFTFYEKFEYWAFIWGTAIMGITGLGLWFTTQTLSLVPKWVLDLFTVIHFYEAILATLAILVWHLYWVMFDPEVYPLSVSMFQERALQMERENPDEGSESEG